MSDELIFSPNEAILSNLSRLSKEHSIISEQRMYELHDIAVSMADASVSLMSDGLDIYEVLSVISEGLSLGDYSLSDENAQECEKILGSTLNALCRTDRYLITRLYLSALAERGVSLKESDFLPGELGDETFTYVRNSLSDEAYDVFSQDFSDPKVRYSLTFKDCARAVSSGEVTYCLFPLEERGGTRLPTISEIIYRNDFRINSVIPVFGPDGNADMKYALLSKSFTVPQRGRDDDLYLEIRLGSDDNSALTDVLCAVDYLGMSVYRVNTVTFDTEGESETYFSLVIKDKDVGFTSLLTYFALFVRDFVPVGIYKNLE